MKRLIGQCTHQMDSLWELLNLGTPEETAWMADALCAQTDPDAFFPERGESPRPAKAVCEVCPVRTECGAYALRRNERFGVWGGLSESDRRKLRRTERIHPSGSSVGVAA
jgi:WhiB family redox-sensing transcriptional regulator